MWYFVERLCGSLKRAMWYFEEGGMVLFRGYVVLWRGWCSTLERVVLYFEKGGVVVFEEGSMVL